MNSESSSSFRRGVLSALLVFLLAFAWFWFWRPYGFYGGDSEYIERQVNGGLWFRKREPLAIAAMQLSRQFFTLRLGWPVSWSISFVSCLCGALSVVALRRIAAGWQRPFLGFALALCSGYLLLYHGSIEAYALPTLALSLWVLALFEIEKGNWPTWTIPAAFAAMVWCHFMGFFLFPALLYSAWIYRDRLKTERGYWAAALAAAFGVYAMTKWLRVGQGLGFEGVGVLFADTGEKDYGPFLSLTHLKIKSYFLWVGTHLTLPFAAMAIWKGRKNAAILQIGAISLCALGFLVVFHPDTGYRDWDLFAFPSLPLAVLGAWYVAQSKHPKVFACVWFLAFLAVWAPRVPVWANLSDRGLAEVRILNFPEDRSIRVDERYQVPKASFYVQGGTHTISAVKRGEQTLFKQISVSPGDEIDLEVPVESIPVPFAEEIRKLTEESGPNSLGN